MSGSRGVLVAVVLLALALGGYGFKLLRESGQRAAAVDQLVADVESEIAKPSPDSSELSALATRIRKVEGHESNRALRVALARIDIERGREEQALRDLEPLGDHGTREGRVEATAPEVETDVDFLQVLPAAALVAAHLCTRALDPNERATHLPGLRILRAQHGLGTDLGKCAGGEREDRREQECARVLHGDLTVE